MTDPRVIEALEGLYESSQETNRLLRDLVEHIAHPPIVVQQIPTTLSGREIYESILLKAQLSVSTATDVSQATNEETKKSRGTDA